MLTKNYTWETFSNHGITYGANDNSLEMVHNSVHNLVGQDPTLDRKHRPKDPITGHMGSVPHAAFDPIFWMHHCNVDRLLALWQALNYDIWVSPGTNRIGTMGLLPGQVLTEETPLEPFYTSSQDPWQSENLRDWEKLGYSYPDFDDVKGKSKEAKKKYISKYISTRYGFRTTELDNPALVYMSSFQRTTGEHEADLKMYDWTIHVSFRYHEFKNTFSIVFYFGSEGSLTLKNVIGTIDAFRGTTAETCENCADNDDQIVEGFVHLNYYIGRDIGHDTRTFDPKIVAEYLKTKKIRCRVNSGEGKLTSLAVEVKATPFYIPVGEVLPRLDQEAEPVSYTDLVQVDD